MKNQALKEIFVEFVKHAIEQIVQQGFDLKAVEKTLC